MAGIGIDLLDIGRLAQALVRQPDLAPRLFTAREREEAGDRPGSATGLAARFCAKEAIVKALALDFWDPHDIEVVGAAEPVPSVHLSGRAEMRARELGATVSVSLSHAGGLAGAVAHARPRDRSQIRANA